MAAKRLLCGGMGMTIKKTAGAVQYRHAGDTAPDGGGAAAVGAGRGLTAAAGEHAVRTHRGVSLRQRPDGGVDPRQLGRILCHFRGDAGVGERDLLQNGPQNTGKMLLHAADAAPPLPARMAAASIPPMVMEPACGW